MNSTATAQESDVEPASGFSAHVHRARILPTTIGHRILETLLPPTCLTCHQRTDKVGTVCVRCWNSIRFIEKPFCEVLGTPFAYDLGEGALSAEAIANPPPFERLRSIAHYDDTIRQLVLSLKFSDRTDLAPWMADWMVQWVKRSAPELLENNPLIVPVPLHRRRLLSRRFNQSAELARPFARLADCVYAPELLERSRSTRQQVGLKQSERAANVRGAFRVPASRNIEVSHRRVLLIDDVYTTGATLEACARALIRGGAAGVDCLTFARVAPEEG
ncbi:MAG: ComF family protein [Pseudomonadota bacterium]